MALHEGCTAESLRRSLRAQSLTASMSGSLRTIQACILAHVHPSFIRRWADSRFALAGLVSPTTTLLPPDLFLASETLSSMRLQARERGRAQARVPAMVLLPRRGTPGCGTCKAFPHVSSGVVVATLAVLESPHGAAARAGAAGSASDGVLPRCPLVCV